MTVNSTSTREFSIDQVVRLAIQTAGLMPAGGAQSGIQWDNYAGQARDFLEVLLDSLPTSGALDRTASLYPVTLIAATTTYVMPATTVAVFGDAMYTAPSTTVGATLVKPITRAEYQVLSDKTSQGTPSLYWSEAGSSVTLYLWPVPSAAGTLTVQRTRLLADVNDGSKTVDLERYWMKYLISAVAHEVGLANGIPEPRLGYIRGERESSKKLARSMGLSTVPGQATVSHRTGWTK